MTHFNYYQNEQEAYEAPGFLYADIPIGITEEDDLLGYYKKLKWIAPYFGGNINALDEVLRDVTFYPASKNKIIHHDIPTISKGEWVGHYLVILDRAIQYLELHRELKHQTKPPYAAELKVYFPNGYQDKIEELGRKYDTGSVRERVMNNDQERQSILNWGESSIKSGEWLKWRKEIDLPDQVE